MKHSYLLLLTFCFTFFQSQSQTIGTVNLNYSDVEDGYTLVTPLNFTTTYLINNCGDVINSWDSDYPPGNECFLDAEGNLWRAGRTSGSETVGAGGRGGIIELYNWEGDLLWSYERCNLEECLHHEFELLPNGNLLLLIWDAYSYEEALEQGFNPDLLEEETELWSDYLEEITPNLDEDNSATTVWQWHAWDHLVQDYDSEKPNFGVVGDHPGKVDLNYGAELLPDWLHCNALDYNEDLDQIIISVPHFDEFWIVDHGLSTEEVAGEAGELLYRWGNPITYGAGVSEDQQVHFSHNAHWVESDLRFGGDIILFDNRNQVGDEFFSTIKVISPTMNEDGTYEMGNGAFLPENTTYEYNLPSELISDKVSGVQVQPNDNLLICSGVKGTIHEINASDEEVWRYKIPVSNSGEIITQNDDEASNLPLKWLFRAYKYAPDFEGFSDKDLTPGDPIESSPELSYCEVVSVSEHTPRTLDFYPNPAEDFIQLGDNIESIFVYSSDGKILLSESTLNTMNSIDVSNLPKGAYFAQAVLVGGEVGIFRFIK